jgi:3-hydroxyacyl-CoA dehydrogenase
VNLGRIASESNNARYELKCPLWFKTALSALSLRSEKDMNDLLIEAAVEKYGLKKPVPSVLNKILRSKTIVS